MKSIVKKKKVIISLSISLYFTLILFFPFFVDLNQKKIFTYYPNAITDEQDSSFEIHDYDKDRNKFTSKSNDPWFCIHAMSSVNTAYVGFTNALNEPLKINVYYSNDTVFNESEVRNYTLNPGNKEAMIKLDDEYSNLRIDIGDNINQSFYLDKIVLSNNQPHMIILIETLILGVLLFGIIYYILNIDVIYIRLRDFYNKSYIKDNEVFIYGILIFTLLFCMLYFKYIYLNEAYIFSDGDICGDTLDGIYPAYYTLSKKIHSGSFSLYSFHSGFGMSDFGIISVFFQPFNLITVLFPIDKLEIGILFSVYLRLLLVMTYALKYFKLFYKNNIVIIISSLLWTFCSYMVVWGQQYDFISNIAYFTMLNYYLHLLCSKKGKGIGVVVTLILIAFSGYYFFYTIGIYSIIYIMLFFIIYKRDICNIFSYSLKMLGYALIAIGIASFVLLPEICLFLDSARTSAISNLSQNLYGFLDLKALLSMIGRFLSSNLLGTALDGTIYSNNFPGLNYYEMAFLGVSTLSLYAINYYMYTYKGPKSIIRFIILVLVISLSTFIVSFFLTLGLNFRWTYMIIFLQVILLSRYLNFLLDEYDQQLVLKVNRKTVLEYLLLTLILLYGNYIEIISLNYRILLIVWCFIIAYTFIVSQKKLKIIVVFIITIEILYSNYPLISNRGTEQISDLHHKYYYDGTMESVNEIVEDDSSIYRLNKTYFSRFYNDAKVQGYKGMSIYASVNSSMLQQLLATYGIKESYNHPNYFKVDYDELFLNGLFGVKYIISDVKMDGLEIVYESDYFVYRNPYSLPFGFLYDKKIDISEVPEEIRDNYIFLGYFDDSLIGDDTEKLWIENKYLFKKVNQNTYKLELENIESNYISIDLKYESDITCVANTRVYIDGKLEKNYDYTSVPGLNDLNVNIPYQKKLNHDIKVEIEFMEEETREKSLNADVRLYNESSIQNIITHYQNQSLVISDFNDDYIKGFIDNDSNENKMLFIPIVYSEEWSVLMDGEKKEISSVNGGFTGVIITPGEHSVELRFIPKGFKIGKFISLGSLLCLFVKYLTKKKFFFELH